MQIRNSSGELLFKVSHEEAALLGTWALAQAKEWAGCEICDGGDTQ